MKRLFLNNEEIFISRYNNCVNTEKEDYELYLTLNIKDAAEYKEACKIKDIKPGDTLKFSASNSLVRITTEIEVQEQVSYCLNPDDFLNNVASMHFRFIIKNEMKESMKDLTEI